MGSIVKWILSIVIISSLLIISCGKGEEASQQAQLAQFQQRLTELEQRLNSLEQEVNELRSGVSQIPTPIPRTATLVVAASNSSDLGKRQADYVCDGVDDQVEIQAAIDALPANGGKVLLMEGTYLITAQILPTAYLTLMGCGAGTIIKLADGTNPVGTEGQLIRVETNLVHITLNDFVIDCNKDNNTGEMAGVWVRSGCHYFTARGLTIRNAVYSGFHFGDSSYALVEGNILHDIIGQFGMAIAFSSQSKSIIANNRIYNVTEGIHLCDPTTDCVIIGNVIDTTTSRGIFLASPNRNLRNIITDNQLKDCESRGIWLEYAEDNIIRNNIFYSCSNPIVFGTAANCKNNKVFEQYADLFMDCLAASTNHAGSWAGTGEEQEIASGITNPDVPRNLSVTCTNIASPNGDVEIEGKDAKGNSISETFTIRGGGTVYGSKAFSKIITITIPAGVSASDTVSVGISDKLGLPNVIYEAGDVYKVKRNNADATIGTVDVANGTVDCATITAGDDFTIYYRSNLNILG